MHDDERAEGPPRKSARPGAEAGVDSAPARPSPYVHPEWTVGLVVVGGVITLLFGVLVSPIWLVAGSPFVIVLALWLYVRVFAGPRSR